MEIGLLVAHPTKNSLKEYNPHAPPTLWGGTGILPSALMVWPLQSNLSPLPLPLPLTLTLDPHPWPATLTLDPLPLPLTRDPRFRNVGRGVGEITLHNSYMSL